MQVIEHGLPGRQFNRRAAVACRLAARYVRCGKKLAIIVAYIAVNDYKPPFSHLIAADYGLFQSHHRLLGQLKNTSQPRGLTSGARRSDVGGSGVRPRKLGGRPLRPSCSTSLQRRHSLRKSITCDFEFQMKIQNCKL